MRIDLKHENATKKLHLAKEVQLFDDRNVKLDMSDVLSVEVNASDPHEPITITVVHYLSGFGDGK